MDPSETMVQSTGSGELKQKKNALEDIKIEKRAKEYTFLGKNLLAFIQTSVTFLPKSLFPHLL